MRYLTALVLWLVGALSASANGVNVVGYVGCSNSANSVSGYHLVVGNKNLLWPQYDTGGGSIDKWAPSSSVYWQRYKLMVTRYGQPTSVWVQLCEKASTTLATYTQVKNMIANLKAISPQALIYVSAINLYNPITICNMMGAGGRGVVDTVRFRERLVADGLALRGPDSVAGESDGYSFGLGPLTTSNTQTDHCHPNSAGMKLLGEQLQIFFDGT